MRRWAAWILTAAACAGLLGGCNKQEEPSETPPYPALVNGVEIIRRPKRVAVCSPSLAEVAADMGYAGQLCGRTDECDKPADVAALPSAGKLYEMNLEIIKRWVPELLVLDAEPDSETGIALHEAGISVLVIPPAAAYGDLAGVYRTMGIVFEGAVQGPASGAAMQARLDEALEAVEAKTAAAAPETRKKALIVTDAFGHAVTGGTTPHALFDVIGADNPAAAEINWTATADQKKAAEVIFCPAALVDTVKGMEHFKDSPAVKAGAVYGIDITAVERQGLRLGTVAGEMAKILYPAAFAEETATETGTQATA